MVRPRNYEWGLQLIDGDGEVLETFVFDTKRDALKYFKNWTITDDDCVRVDLIKERFYVDGNGELIDRVIVEDETLYTGE